MKDTQNRFNRNKSTHADFARSPKNHNASPLLRGIGTIALVASLTASAHGVVVEGDVPSLPWADSADLYVGWTSWGSIQIGAGEEIYSGSTVIGRDVGSSGEVAVSGAYARWITESVSVGYNGNGTLTIANSGGVISTGLARIGSETSSTGTAIVTGEGSRWNTSDGIEVGSYGDGALTIMDGGRVISTSSSIIGHYSGSTGTVTVTGENSQWNAFRMYVGGQGDGTLMIKDGGKIVTTAETRIGNWVGGTGTVTVTGNGSQWDGPGLGVSSGTLTITDGGKINSYGITSIGGRSDATAAATVSGNGSTWSTSVIRIGSRSTLVITDGGRVDSNAASIGDSLNLVTTVAVSGNGSRWNTSGITIGNEGAATLTIESNALVQVRNSGSSDFSISSYGVMQISGGFFAWKGDHFDVLLEMILRGAIQYWDGTSYVSLTPSDDYLKYFTLEYVANLSASEFAELAEIYGDADLDGHTILTAVPEPGTYALLLSVLIGGIALYRRKRSA